mmetsp:Transcript_63011/g.73707  ORF Transcript_63011/g.73707 Transcript_63011/m.73707 type:complete len:610 (+) Transcript_63011:134-1963(+)
MLLPSFVWITVFLTALTKHPSVVRSFRFPSVRVNRSFFQRAPFRADNGVPNIPGRGVGTTRAFSTSTRNDVIPVDETMISPDDDLDDEMGFFLEDETHEYESMDDVRAVRRYTKLAIVERGTPTGLRALEILSFLSARRTPFLVPDNQSPCNDHKRIISSHTNLFPVPVTRRLTDIVEHVERNGWLSTNPDSVDGIPSFHLNLITNGNPKYTDEDNEGLTTSEYYSCVKELVTLVTPYLYEQLLPRVQSLVNSSTVSISEVFIRRYGDNDDDEEKEEEQEEEERQPRYGISAHYDVTSLVTSVIALDDVASTGRSGLYTVLCEDTKKDDGDSLGASNHVALRRYFKLNSGDAVIHTWDVLHGVDIVPGQKRTSLVVWFTDEGESGDEAKDSNHGSTSPWLQNPRNDDDVGLFVLASAKESLAEEEGDDDLEGLHSLYLKSASLGNAFAFTRLGALCTDNELSSTCASWAYTVLNHARDDSPFLPNHDPFSPYHGDEDAQYPPPEILAKAFYFEGAMRGDARAQVELGDDCMEHSFLIDDYDMVEDLRLFAAVLFGLASMQGDDAATKNLEQLLQMEYSNRVEEGVEPCDILSSPMFLTAQSSEIAHLSS